MTCEECKNTTCPCTYAGCPRHGKCKACVAYHRKNQELPACYFTADKEKTYDRSFENFARLVKEGKI